MASISHFPREIASLTLAQVSAIVTEFGVCSGTGDDRWYPDVEPTGERDRAEYEATARKVCADCPVRAECLDLALRTESRHGVRPHGIWGGTAPWERERMLRSIRRRACQAARAAESQVAEGVAS
jgi:WhiB family redox-sensing transcriptional regulator